MLLRKLKEIKAFTLIELMIVIAIILILAAIVIPNVLVGVGALKGGDSTQQVEIIDQQDELRLQTPIDNGTSDKGETNKL